jgi:hypothetical protein
MNRSFAQIRIALYAIAVTFALAGAARAQQALPGIDDAQLAVDRATQADADQYTPDLIASARAHLEQAQAASMDRRAQKQVPALATQAALEADLARARSMETVANAKLAQRRSDIQQLQRTLGGNAGGTP